MKLNYYLNLPNLISLTRLFLSPFILFVPEGFIAVFFFLLALSDALDGFLARRLKKQTQLGKVLDPLADKVMILCGLYLCTFKLGLLPGILLYLTLLRDAFILLGSILLVAKKKIIPSARYFGKAFTLFFSFMIVLCMLGVSVKALLWLVFFLLFASWVDYALLGLKILKS
ncbi:MAG: CDP-alcohol phosphatidyltransferase family protein [Aquificaceae bacterium]